MINFCLTNNTNIINTHQYTNSIRLSNDFVLYYNDGVELYEDDSYIQLFVGILWNYDKSDILGVNDIPARDLYNGQFYCFEFDKLNNKIRVITDFKEDFPVYYHIEDGNAVITNKMISLKYGYFKENEEWHRLSTEEKSFVTTYTQRPPNIDCSEILLIHHAHYKSDSVIIKNIHRLGTSGILNFDLNNCEYQITRYYNQYNDVMFSFNNPHRLTHDEFKEKVHDILIRNLKKVIKEHQNITVCSSNGSDSMLLLSCLTELTDNFNLLGYHDSSLSKDRRLTEKMNGLFDLFERSKLVDTTQEMDLKAIRDIKNRCQNPTVEVAQFLQNGILRDNTKSTDTILMGNHGDHVFWHHPKILLLDYYFHTEYKTIEEIHTNTVDSYSHQKFRFDKYSGIIDRVKKHPAVTFNDLIACEVHSRFTYSKDDRNFSNRMIISPYTDLELSSLLAKCDLETQRDNIYDIKTQKELINPDFLPYLNTRKEGGEDHYFNDDGTSYEVYIPLTVECFLTKWKEESKSS